MKSFFRILSYGKPYGRQGVAYVLLSLLGVLFGIANYALIAPLLTVLFEPHTLETVPIYPERAFSFSYIVQLFKYHLIRIILEEGVLMALLYVSVCLVAASLLSNLTQYITRRILINVQTNLIKNVRNHVFSEITRLPLGYFHQRRKGDILSVVSGDIIEIQHSIAGMFHVLFRDPLLIIGFLIVLFYMSPRLTLVACFTLPISAFCIGRITRTLRSGAEVSQRLLGRLLSHFEEAVHGIRIIKAFHARDYVNDRFDKVNEIHRKEIKIVLNRQELASPLSEFLGITIAAGILFYGGWLQVQGKLGMGWPAFVVYIGFYWRVLEPAKSISKAYAMIRKGMVSAERIFQLLDVPKELEEKSDNVPLDTLKQSVVYKNITFRYSANGPDVLRNINLEIPKGQVVAWIGPSGAGKTTMADLLSGFYRVQEGEILLDGIPINDYHKEDLAKQIGIVTQEAILFNDTVANNITFGLKKVPPEEVEQAARIANAHDFIMEMEHGYLSNIGEKGEKLSGGQRQRLTIARAVLRNPALLILDEATSSLDAENEAMVQEALARLMKDRTTIVIAHRLSTIRYADNIVVFEGGRIVEQGTYEKLFKTNKYESEHFEHKVPE